MKEFYLKFYECGFYITTFDDGDTPPPYFKDKDSLRKAIDLIKEIAGFNKNNLFFDRSGSTFREPTLTCSIGNYLLIRNEGIEYVFLFTKVDPESYSVHVTHLLNVVDEFSKKYI
jgi:hypothetical protein